MKEKLVGQGRSAEQKQDWLAAARAYDSACRIDPKDVSSCQRGQEMRDYAANLRSYNARRQCEAGQITACLTTLAPVRNIRSANQGKVLAVVELATEKVMVRCAADDDSTKSIVREVGCLQVFQPSLWENSKFRRHFAAKSEDAANELSTFSESQSSPGSALALLQAAQCVVPLGDDELARLRAAERSFKAKAQVLLRLSYSVHGKRSAAPGSCQETVAAIGSGLRCDVGSNPTNPLLAVSAEIFSIKPRWVRSREDESKSVRYLAGTQMVSNPDYNQARLEYQNADRNFSDIQRITEEREYLCNKNGSKYDCDRYNATVKLYNQRQDELRRAKSNFSNEPQSVQQKVYRDHRYVRTTHRWSAPYRASIAIGNEVPSPAITEIVYTDVEQRGFSEAGIATDYLQAPGPTFFRDQGSKWLMSRVKARVKAELHARGQRMIDDCDDDGLACEVTARYWRGQTQFAIWLLNGLSHDNRLSNNEQLDMRCTSALLR